MEGIVNQRTKSWSNNYWRSIKTTCCNL